MSPKDFRECAGECLDWAKTAKSDKERTSFLQLTETWLKAAAEYETEKMRGHRLSDLKPSTCWPPSTDNSRPYTRGPKVLARPERFRPPVSLET